mgnify:CR=1 FL=1
MKIIRKKLTILPASCNQLVKSFYKVYDPGCPWSLRLSPVSVVLGE